ncbi:D-sedoheptulose 7-phosphate isomerase [candidate division KSB1 bacterium]|nr:D-sedoheptulose 7-phosphate isomerase [candidate division KSB1 bacterium]
MKSWFKESARIKTLLAETFSESVNETATLLIKALQKEGKILICGNGGSAADAQHFAAELVGRFKRDRSPLAALALTTDTSILTAVGNDFEYDKVYQQQVEALAKKNDILVVLSTSGNSKNIVRAISAAKARGIKTIALLGRDGGQILGLSDYSIVVPAQGSDRIQEGHITIIHIWCDLIENAMFP